IRNFLFEEHSIGVFVLVTLILGGGAAWLTGRAIALTWRPWWQLTGYTLLLGLSVRFIHHALFGGTFLSPYYYVIDTTICFIVSLLGYGATRAEQMATQYHWLHKRTGPFSWSRR